LFCGSVRTPEASLLSIEKIARLKIDNEGVCGARHRNCSPAKLAANGATFSLHPEKWHRSPKHQVERVEFVDYDVESLNRVCSVTRVPHAAARLPLKVSRFACVARAIAADWLTVSLIAEVVIADDAVWAAVASSLWFSDGVSSLPDVRGVSVVLGGKERWPLPGFLPKVQ
jgi:hypothetical protein